MTLLLFFLLGFFSKFGICKLASDFSVAFIADPHVGESPMRLEYLKRVVRKVNERIEEDQIVCLFIAGDLTDDGKRDTFSGSIKVLDEELEIPYFSAIGNHDTFNYGRKYFHKYFSERILSSPYTLNYTGTTPYIVIHEKHHDVTNELYAEDYLLKIGNAYFFVLDWTFKDDQSASRSSSKAHLNSIGFDFLKENLKKYRSYEGSRFYILQHHPIAAHVHPQSEDEWGISHKDQKKLFKKIFDPILLHPKDEKDDHGYDDDDDDDDSKKKNYKHFFGSVFVGHVHYPSIGSVFDKKKYNKKLPSSFIQYNLETSSHENAFYVASFNETTGEMIDFTKYPNRLYIWEAIGIEILGFSLFFVMIISCHPLLLLFLSFFVVL